MKKGQTSLEFMILTAVLLFFFVAVFYILASRFGDVQKIRSEDMAEDLFDLVNNEVSLARSNLQGYIRDFELPPTMNGLDYNLYLIVLDTQNKTELVVRVENYEEYFILSDKVYGSLGIGRNTVTNKDGRVEFIADAPFPRPETVSIS